VDQVFKLGDGKNEGQVSCLRVDNRWNAELRLHEVVGIARVAAIWRKDGNELR
jgi:hypothetical protein